MTQSEPGTTAAEAQELAVYYVEFARLAGWRAAIEAAGLEWDTIPVAGAVGHGRVIGRAAGAQLLDRAERPTAILALSDLLAIGVLDAAAERGISVPGELSVAGFDDIPQAATVTPALTTVNQPHHRKGAEAVRLLLADDPAQNVLLPTELVVRASTGPAPRKESSP
jgi:DNA-binding LacI/PurR family transcriptional regulator